MITECVSQIQTVGNRLVTSICTALSQVSPSRARGRARQFGAAPRRRNSAARRREGQANAYRQPWSSPLPRWLGPEAQGMPKPWRVPERRGCSTPPGSTQLTEEPRQLLDRRLLPTEILASHEGSVLAPVMKPGSHLVESARYCTT